jgi:uncharacterized protein YlxW (UPF0749 family)
LLDRWSPAAVNLARFVCNFRLGDDASTVSNEDGSHKNKTEHKESYDNIHQQFQKKDIEVKKLSEELDKLSSKMRHNAKAFEKI